MRYDRTIKEKRIKECLNDLESLIQVLEGNNDFFDRNLMISETNHFLTNNKKFLDNLIDPYWSIKENKKPWNVETGHIRIFLDHLNNEPFNYDIKQISKESKILTKELTDLFRDLTLRFLL